MKWQGQSDNLIDRFDGRAHLDYIPPVKATKEETDTETSSEERLVNYERYRILAQNEFLGVTEDNFLKQLLLEEQLLGVNAHQAENDKNKKKSSQATAAIGYNYEDSSTTTVPFSQTIMNIESSSTSNRFEEFSKDLSDDSDVDMDTAIDINKIGMTEAHELNNCGKRYGMMTNDFFSYLTKDEDEKQSMKALKEQEADKVLGGGRKSRRERRERKFHGKPTSPPSYAAKEDKPKLLEESDDDDDKSSRNNSRSPSPEKITYITSFGGEDELKPHAKISISLNKPTVRTPGSYRAMGSSSYADKVKQNIDKLKKLNDYERDKVSSRRRSRSISERRRRNASPRGRYRDSSRSRSTSRRRRYSSRSTSGSRRRNYSSRSRSNSRRRTRSSRSYSRTSYSSDSRDLSRSSKRRKLSPKKQVYRKKSSSRRRSYSCDTSESRRRSMSRKRSYTPKKSSRSKSRKRSYSSSSSSTTDSSSSSSVRTSPKKLRSKSREKVPRPKTKSLSKEKTSHSQAPVASSSETAPIKRYYGRRKGDESSSSLSVDSGSEDDDKNTGSNQR